MTEAGAIPILVDHLNHDMARVRIEATRALWSLAENNLETWEKREICRNIALKKRRCCFFWWGWLVAAWLVGWCKFMDLFVSCKVVFS